MKTIIKNEILNKTFEERGYVSFPLFSPQEVQEIKKFYATIKGDHTSANSFFHTTLNTSNEHLIRRVNGFLRPYFQKNLATYLEGFELTIAGFLAKDSGPKTMVNMHQDWTYVDEQKFQAFNLWVCLDDTNRRNGCMQFVPYSHRFVDTLRVSPDIPGYFDSFKKEILPYLVDVPTKAGECVIFHQAILHASRKNISGKQRTACISCAYPSAAKLLHYFSPDPPSAGKLEKYEINLESLIQLKKDSRPDPGRLIENLDYNPPKVNLEDFKEYFGQRISVFSRVKFFFINSVLGKIL